MRIVDIIIALPSLLYTILLMMLMGSNIRSILIALLPVLLGRHGTHHTFAGRQPEASGIRPRCEARRRKRFPDSSASSSAERYGSHHRIGHVPDSGARFSRKRSSPSSASAFRNRWRRGALWQTMPSGTLTSAPYQMFFPIAAISLTMFSLNFIGDGLRDALDPKLKK